MANKTTSYKNTNYNTNNNTSNSTSTSTNTNYNTNNSTSTSTNTNNNNNNNYNRYDNSTVTTGPQGTTTVAGGRTDTNNTNTSTNTSDKADQAWRRSPYYAGLRTAGDFGINPEALDQDKLYDLYAQAAGTARDTALAELGVAKNEFANNIRTAQDSYLDTVRRANAGAIQSGASKGVQAANELSALLGLQQQTTADATKLANQRVDIGNTYAQAMSDAAVNAEKDVFNRNKIIADILNTALGADNNALGMLNYGALADYLSNNSYGGNSSTAVTGPQVTTENKTGVDQITKYWK